ncbi:MAG: AAA family ATPase, partial [Patescibacteria group bacterium]|nr:AAA family ATPase [Patescibacteria group bacterium]
MADYLDYSQRASDLGLLVVVGGPGGTGSSTIAKILARKWKLHHIYAGAIMRKICGKQDLNECLKELAENNSDHDMEIDKYITKMSQRPNTLIESKSFAGTATHKKIPCSAKIWITTSLESRVN